MNRPTPRLFTLAAAAIAAITLLARAQPPEPRTPDAFWTRYQGQLAVDGIASPARVERDDRGVPRILADTLADACFAQGYCHAQDRLVQMTLFRRFMRGRLAELIGPEGLPADRYSLSYGFARVAPAITESLPPRQLALLEAYARGVNAGVNALPLLPPELIVLGHKPEHWTATDSVLMVQLMFLGLSTDFGEELARNVAGDALPDEILRFIVPTTSRYEAPTTGPEDGGYRPTPIPGPEILDWRGQSPEGWLPTPGLPWPVPDGSPEDTFAPLIGASPENTPGSNAWAVSGSRTPHSGAIVASDMHQPLSIPNTWYRIELRWGGGDWSTREVSQRRGQTAGLSLPGVPGVVAGSNGRVAFGSTNLLADVLDRIVIERHDASTIRSELVDIPVRGRPDAQAFIQTSPWGPVRELDHRGRPLATRWTALDPRTLDLGMLDLMLANDAEQAVAVAKAMRGPPLNVLIADREGRIAWTTSGWIPRREGFDGSTPVAWNEQTGWRGPLPAERMPSAIAPEAGYLFNANNRSGTTDAFAPIGRVFAHPARALRVRQILHAAVNADELAHFRYQHDTRALAIDPYREVLLEIAQGWTPTGSFSDRRRTERFIEYVRAWEGDASADSPGYRLIRLFRTILIRELIGALARPCLQVDPTFRLWPPTDEPVLRLLEERPAHLVPPVASSWTAYLRGAAVRAAALADAPPHSVDTTWGETNRLAMRHPFSSALAGLPDAIAGPIAAKLDMPAYARGGDAQTICVARPTFGATNRLVVSPGRERHGILNIPGGQSGNPFSPHYRDAHHAWSAARPDPLLAGATHSALVLTPNN